MSSPIPVDRVRATDDGYLVTCGDCGHSAVVSPLGTGGIDAAYDALGAHIADCDGPWRRRHRAFTLRPALAPVIPIRRR